MKYKFTLILLLSCLNLGFSQTPINNDNAPSIQNDLLLHNTLQGSNWQPGGKFDDFKGDHRGSVANQHSSVSINPGVSTRIGSFSIQNATISGNHYFETHFSNHPYWEHAPFDDVKANSASNTENFISGSQSGYELYWTNTKIHPSDGYDGAQGGGYPKPAGAYDTYSVDLSGFAVATYFVPGWDTVVYPNNNKNPITNIVDTHNSGIDKIHTVWNSDKGAFEKILGIFNGSVESTIGAIGAGAGTPINNITEYTWNNVLLGTGNAEIKAVQNMSVNAQNNYINLMGSSLTQESMVAVNNIAALLLTKKTIDSAIKTPLPKIGITSPTQFKPLVNPINEGRSLPKTKKSLYADLESQGFSRLSKSAGGYETWTMGRSKVTIKPDGEVIRTETKNIPGAKRGEKQVYPERQDYFGDPLPGGSHITNHFVK